MHTLFLGSLFTTDGYPNIDLEEGGSIDGLIATASKFLGMFGSDPEDVEPIVPGRGPLATMQDLRDYHQMLVTIRSRVDSLVEKGAAVEDVIRARPTAEFDTRWSKGPVSPKQFVALVYRSLQQTRNK